MIGRLPAAAGPQLENVAFTIGDTNRDGLFVTWP